MSTQSQTGQRYRIGYALKRVQTFNQPSLVTEATKRGIDLIPIDTDKPLDEQGPFDCIIHKLYGHEWAHNLRQFSATNPGVRVIDSPESIEKLHNRISMLEVVAHLNIDSVGVPNQHAVVSGSSKTSLRFPLIAKPLEVNGTQESHQMYLIFDNEGLGVVDDHDHAVVLQEFVNHGGVMFKVYVAGSSVKCVKRTSLPDISGDEMKSLTSYLPFSMISSSSLNSVDNDDDGSNNLEKVEMPSEGFVVELAREMREALELNLFNFDLIRVNNNNYNSNANIITSDCEDGDDDDGDRYLVLDINYLPGYAQVPDYVSFLMDFFMDLANYKEERANSEVK